MRGVRSPPPETTPVIVLTLPDGTPVPSATDLIDRVSDAHLPQRRLAVARGQRARPRPAEDPYAELIGERGQAHEEEQLAPLGASCGVHVELSTGRRPRSREDLRAAAEAIAMRCAEALIHRARFFDGRWRGLVDFLRRIPPASSLGDHADGVLDTRLACRVGLPRADPIGSTRA